MSDELVAKNRDEVKRRNTGTVRPGFENFGENSYSNATLQALFACEPFRVLVILIGHQFPQIFGHNYLSKLFTGMAEGHEKYFIPFNFEQLPNFNARDSHNFLLWIINVLSIENTQNEFPSAVSVFASNIETSCMTCHTPSSELFHITPLNFNLKNSTVVSVQQLCERFIENNLLEIVNCKICKNLAHKLWHKPEVLIIHLQHNNAHTKPELIAEETLNLEEELYQLIACICDGSASYYYCYANIANVWYCFADRNVTEIGSRMPAQNMLQNVCILFYKRYKSRFHERFKQMADSKVPQMMRSKISKKQQKYPWIARPYQQTPPPLHRLPQITFSEDFIGESIKQNKGLENQLDLNICWMNCILQALFHCEQFRLHILTGGHSGLVHRELAKYFMEMSYNKTDKCVSAKGFFHTFGAIHKQFAKTEGNRSTIFCTKLLEKLKDEAKQDERNQHLFGFPLYPFKEDAAEASSDAFVKYLIGQKYSYIARLFAIQWISEDRCRYGHVMEKEFKHHFADFYTDTPDDYQSGYLDVQMLIDSSSKPSLRKTGCEYCKPSFEQLYHYYSISRASNIFIVYTALTYAEESGTYKLAEIIVNETVVVCSVQYSLKAVVINLYQGINTLAHLFTYAKTDSAWYEYNDQTVSRIDNVLAVVNHLPEDRFICAIFYEKSIVGSQPTNYEDIRLLESIGKFALPSHKVALINANSTSYMNCALQCLYHCKDFRNYMVYGSGCGLIHNSLRSLFVRMLDINELKVNANQLWKCFADNHSKFSIIKEHDSQLFLSILINDLHKEMNRTIYKLNTTDTTPTKADLNKCLTSSEAWTKYRTYIDNSYLVDLFAFLNASITECNTCGANSKNYQPKWILSLENLENQSTENYNIQLIINWFLAPKSVVCHKCQNNAVKWNVMSHLPNILIIKLTIFRYKMVNNQLIKVIIDPRVVICEEIELNGQRFVCRACICYRESNTGSPYYHAVAKCDEDWYRFNDLVVKLEETRESVDGMPTESDLQGVYVLFYEKTPRHPIKPLQYPVN